MSQSPALLEPLQAPIGVSIVIATYSDVRWQLLGHAISSVRAGGVQPSEVIIAVDNNRGLAERVRNAMPGIRVVEHDGPRGVAGCRNAGAAAAHHEILAFLDDDAVASPGWLHAIREAVRDLNVAGVGGLATPAWEDGKPAWFPDCFSWTVGCTSESQSMEGRRQVRNVFGGNMAVRTAVFRAVGGFRQPSQRVNSRTVSLRRVFGKVAATPSYGCEETELCIRVSQHMPSARWMAVPEMTIVHRVSKDRSTYRYFMRRCFTEGREKAFLVVRNVGFAEGLRTERQYTRQLLTRDILPAARKRSLAGFCEALAIVSGFTAALAGFAVGLAGGEHSLHLRPVDSREMDP